MTPQLKHALTALLLLLGSERVLANDSDRPAERPLNLNLPAYTGMSAPSTSGPWLSPAQHTASAPALPFGSGYENRQNSHTPRPSDGSGPSHTRGERSQGRGQGQRRGR